MFCLTVMAHCFNNFNPASACNVAPASACDVAPILIIPMKPEEKVDNYCKALENIMHMNGTVDEDIVTFKGKQAMEYTG